MRYQEKRSQSLDDVSDTLNPSEEALLGEDAVPSQRHRRWQHGWLIHLGLGVLWIVAFGLVALWAQCISTRQPVAETTSKYERGRYNGNVDILRSTSGHY